MLVLAMCPALLRHASVDLPDDYLEYGVTDFAFFAEEMRHGRLPSWNPYKHGGGSVFGDLSRMSSAYPVALLLLLLPLDLAMLLVWVGHLALGALGVQHLTRTLGAGRTGGMAGGIAYLFASLPVVAVVDGTLDNLPFIALLPWVLRAIARAASAQAEAGGERAAMRHAAVGALLLGLIGLGAHARFAAIAFGASALGGAALWALPPSGRRPPWVRWAIVVVGVLAVGALLAMPVTLPTFREMELTRTAPPGDPGKLVGQVLTWRGLAGLVYPRVLYLDERWHHLGAGLLLCLLGPLRDRRSRAMCLAGAILLLLGMGARGPLFMLVRPLHWLLYPVEVAVGGQALPFLAAATGLCVDRIVSGRREGAAEAEGRGLAGWLDRASLGGPSGALVTAASGIGVVVFAWTASRAMYEPQVRSVPPLEAASLVHGLVAVSVLAGLLSLSRKLAPGRLAAGLLAVLLVDGLAYAWRVQALVPSPSARPEAFVAPPPELDDVGAAPPSGRVLQWPLRPIRDFSGCLDGRTTDEGHGWGRAPWFDPLAVMRGEAALVLAGPLRRNVGSRGQIPQVEGRAKVPPMPWSVFASWLSTSGPADLGARRFIDPDPSNPDRIPGSHDRVATGWGPEGPAPGDDPRDPPQRLAWAVMPRGGPRGGACADGPMSMGARGEGEWMPRVLELLNVRWVLSPFPIDAFPGARALPPRGDALARFEVLDPRPPALLCRRVRQVADARDAERVVFGGPFDLRGTAVVVAGQRNDLPDSPGPPLPARVLGWRPGYWEIELPAGRGLLTVAERWHAGWTARDAQGRTLEVLPANFVQVGVLVPSDAGRVVLRFVAPGARAGLVGLALGLAMLVPALARAGAGRRPGVRTPRRP